MNVQQTTDSAVPVGTHTAAMSKSAAAAVGGVVWQTPLICILAVSIITTSIALAASGIVPIWVTVVANAMAFFMIYTPFHEAVHGNISGRDKSKAWIDLWVGRITGLFISVPFSAHKTIHLTHHRHTNDPDLDPDHWVKGKNALSVWLRCTCVPIGYIVYCLRHWENKELRKTFWVSVGGLAFSATVLTILGFQFGWQIPVLGYFLPAIMANTVLAYLFDWIVHTPHEVQERFANTRVLETDGALDTLATWLDLQQNYHGVHHAFPKIPFVKYRAFFREHRSDFIAAGMPVQRY